MRGVVVSGAFLDICQRLIAVGGEYDDLSVDGGDLVGDAVLPAFSCDLSGASAGAGALALSDLSPACLKLPLTFPRPRAPRRPAGLVAFVRVQAGAHWPSDVLAGLLLGGGVALVVVHGGWGTRLVDWIWRKTVDTSANPAWPDLRETVLDRRKALKTAGPPWWARISSAAALGIIAVALLILVLV